MNLNFKISELVFSEKAKIYKIENTPDLKSLDNMLELICYCLQPIRNKLNKPMYVSSGFRCKELNALVGGAQTSQHLTGNAVDFTVPGMTPAQVVDFIKNSEIEFDQLINEYNSWVHISYNKGKNRKQILKY